MASTREERQQMRQRGAASRKTKEVDFGFSFGGPSFGFPEPAQPAIISKPIIPPPTNNAATPASIPPPQSQTSGPQRTPGSARNNLPPRPSAYDILPENALDQPRSNKRRKINPPDADAEISLENRQSSEPGRPSITAGDSNTQPESETASTAKPPQRKSVDNVPTSLSPHATEAHEAMDTQEARNSPVNGNEAESISSEQQPQQSMDIAPNRSRTSKPTSPPVDINEPPKERPQEIASPIQPVAEAVETQQKRPQRKSISPQASNRKKPKTRIPEIPNGSVEEHEAANAHTPKPTVAASDKPTRVQKAKGKKKAGKGGNNQANGRHSKSPSSNEAEPDTTSGTPDQSEQANTDNPKAAKRPRTRASLGKDSNPIETEAQSQSPSPADPVPPVAESSASGARRARKSTKETHSRPEAQREANEEPEADSSMPKARKGRSGKKAKRAVEQQAEPEARDEEASQEPEEAVEPEAPSQNRSQPKKKTKRGTRSEVPAPEEQEETEASGQAQRKPREPRGETVPVTIHRLANASALDALYNDLDGSGQEDEARADGDSSQQKAKLPSRGGVNPADVLSQICRETLEKTLTTLKTGIENEANAARRAEWTRKRKAVEAFGMELDGRLLDLSEMLDSNFVLGVQLKKAKREMMELRSHLHQVRREREGIALQMDRVRSKHMEEESEKTARSTINNSIHSLELALDRSQHHGQSSTKPSSTELEFLLRTVAEEVSCRAPGASGGLLHQIRSFNTQLESTVRQLEK